MADLLEHVMINKLGDDLDEAITYVGGDTTSVRHISQYPDIIREQLSANGITLDKSIILEGDSCVIIADETGRDEYNTEYAVGVKTGLNPGAYYIRICTAVKDIEPVYIDLTPVTELIGGGIPGDLDIDKIVNMVINSPTMQNNYVSNQEFTNLETTVNEFQTDITEVHNNVTNLETTVNELLNPIDNGSLDEEETDSFFE